LILDRQSDVIVAHFASCYEKQYWK